MLNRPLYLLLILLPLAACETVPQEQEQLQEEQLVSEDLLIEEIPGQEVTRIDFQDLLTAIAEEDPALQDRRRLIADILFEGLQALDADRLLTPIDDNAHARFQRVLAYEPDNEIALQGLQDIVLRYVELAREAGKQGQFEQARLLLDRARFVDTEHPQIAAAWVEIQAEMQSGDLFFDLDDRAVAQRTEAVQQKLADIAMQAKEHDAFVLITSPNDEHARWMFLLMRDAVDGYRLRGNIELAATTRIRLRMPGSAP